MPLQDFGGEDDEDSGRKIRASDEDLNRARHNADLLAAALFDKVYTEIGRSILKKLVWLAIGVLLVVSIRFHIIDFPGAK